MVQDGIDRAFQLVGRLVADFQKHADHFLSPAYQEAEVRKDFIDKFLIALGWDVNHDVQKNPFEQEVKVERQASTGAARRRADYAFHIAPNFRDPRLLLEAKKPSSELATADHYFQTIRYGWSKDTPIAGLTDFANLHLLDCRYKPNIDTAIHGCIKRYSLDDYLVRDKFAEIYWLFSREAVASGSLEKFSLTLDRRKRGPKQQRLFVTGPRQNIGDAFLDDLDRYRRTLAVSFKKRNPELDGDALTEATQRTIDRLVFMRFLEDKLIEPSYMVQGFGQRGSAWKDFIKTSQRLDDVYNGIVFKPHDILDSPTFEMDEDAFADICEELSHENSPYPFHDIPIHILGSIYERFLGNIIEIHNGKADVEPKPEVRKAGGVYYTPDHVVRYIVENTVGKIIDGKTPDQIAEMRFADIACGSGSFLLVVYDVLLRHHEKYYNANPKKARKGDCETKGGVLHLSLDKKCDILLQNIYGVDIDQQAVEVTQLSLYLKLLEEETIASTREYQRRIHHAILPSLHKNIVCGNSLIEPDISKETLFSEEDDKRFNSMSFKIAFRDIMKRGGFDAVVGNPPYIDSEWMTTHHPHERAYCCGKYEAAKGNWDIFCIFVEKTLQACRDGGRVSLIVPNKLGAAGYAAGARQVIDGFDLLAVRDYSSVPVFPVAVYPIVYVVQKQPRPKKRLIAYERMEVQEVGLPRAAMNEQLGYAEYFGEPSRPWRIFASLDAAGPSSRLSKDFPRLMTAAKILGAATVSEAYEIKELISDEPLPASGDFRVVNSGTIDRHQMLWGQKPLRYLKDAYLHPIVSRKAAKLLPVKRRQQSSQPKLIVAGMTRELECVVDLDGCILAAKSTSIITSGLDLHFLAALLNSKLITHWFVTTYGGNALAGGYLRIGPPQLETIPIPRLDLAKKKDKTRYDQLVRLATEQVSARERLAVAKTDRDKRYYQTKVEGLEQHTDTLVYELYGLTEAEIAVVDEEIKQRIQRPTSRRKVIDDAEPSFTFDE